MKKTLLCAAVFLAACTSTSPTQSYRPRGSDDLWNITGTLDSKIQNTLTVKINGETAVAGKLSMLNASGEIPGTYQGHSVVANCTSEQDFDLSTDVQCMILIDNERAATLTFSI